MSDDGLRVVPLGVGDAFSARWYSTTLLVSAGGRHTLIDVPDPIRKVITEAAVPSRPGGPPVRLEDIDDIILTHLHGDHVNGLEMVGFYKHFIQKTRPRVWSVPEVHGPLWEHRLKAPMSKQFDKDFIHEVEVGPETYYDYRTLHRPGFNEVNGLQVEIHPTRHTLPCFGVRITAAGRKFGYSSDTMFLPELIDFLAPCDLIFHETNYGPHTDWHKLAELPAALKARMRLVHYPDNFDEKCAGIALARQGEVFMV